MPGALLREGLLLLAAVGGPVLGTLLLVGLAVGILQAATQINDPAVGFLPRGLAAVAVVWLGGGWIMERLAGFLGQALVRMAGR
jgi:flagellar biosynthesis protein FliQ